jgi:hypothetical protein
MPRNVIRSIVSDAVNPLPEWIDGLGAYIRGNYLYIVGGWNGDGIAPHSRKTLYRYDLTSNTVLALPDAAFNPRHSFGFGKLSSGRFLVIGADSQPETTNADRSEIWYTDNDVTYLLLSTQAFLSDRVLFGCVIEGNSIWIFGGQKASDYTQGYDDVWLSTNGGISFTQISSGNAFLDANLSNQVVKYNGNFYAICAPSRYGNVVGVDRTFSKNVYRSPDGIVWTQVNSFETPTGVQYGFTIVWNFLAWFVNGYMIASDGISANNQNFIWTFNGDDFARIEANMFSTSHACACCLNDDGSKLYIVMGNKEGVENPNQISHLELTDIG